MESELSEKEEFSKRYQSLCCALGDLMFKQDDMEKAKEVVFKEKYALDDKYREHMEKEEKKGQLHEVKNEE